jgi:hypothetical protein
MVNLLAEWACPPRYNFDSNVAAAEIVSGAHPIFAINGLSGLVVNGEGEKGVGWWSKESTLATDEAGRLPVART